MYIYMYTVLIYIYVQYIHIYFFMGRENAPDDISMLMMFALAFIKSTVFLQMPKLRYSKSFDPYICSHKHIFSICIFQMHGRNPPSDP